MTKKRKCYPRHDIKTFFLISRFFFFEKNPARNRAQKKSVISKKSPWYQVFFRQNQPIFDIKRWYRYIAVSWSHINIFCRPLKKNQPRSLPNYLVLWHRSQGSVQEINCSSSWHQSLIKWCYLIEGLEDFVGIPSFLK